jgi:hypothetical protein
MDFDHGRAVAVAGWRAFKEGAAQSLRYWPLLLLFVLAVVGSAGLISLLPGLALLPAAYRPPFAEMLNGVEMWMFLDLLAQTSHPEFGLPQPGLQSALLPWVIAVVLLPLLSTAVLAFFQGGILLSYYEAPERIQWSRFWWGSWHYWGAFLLLGFIQGLLFLFVFLPLAAGGIVLSLRASWLGALVLPLLGLLLLVGVAIGELARAYAVTRGTRNVLRVFVLGVKTIIRRPLLWIGLYFPAVLLLAGLHLVFRLGLLPALEPGMWLLYYIAAQLFILARAWARLLRLSGVVNLVRWI